MGLFHHVLVYMVDLHLVLPALERFSVSPRPLGFGFLGLGLRGFMPGLDNSTPPALKLTTLDAGILILGQQVRMMMFSLNMVEYSMSFLSLST